MHDAMMPNVLDMSPLNPCSIDRREFLWRFGGGLGGIALSCLLGEQQLLADQPQPRAEFNGGLHHRAKAKRVVQLFMSGAASQCDTFDYKPELIRRHGQKFDPGGTVELFQSSAENCMKSPGCSRTCCAFTSLPGGGVATSPGSST